MESNREQIQCPSCGESIDVNEILYHQLEVEVKDNLSREMAEERKRVHEKELLIAKQQEELKLRQQEMSKNIEDQVNSRLGEMTVKLQENARKQAVQEQEQLLAEMRKELQDKSGKLKELHKTKGELERLKREKDELREEIEAEQQKILSETLRAEREKIRRTEESKNELKLRESHELVESLKKQLQEAQRKAEQGSMQSQGEVQELAIEQWLSEQFPLDTIEEIKKGQQGADCLQIVHTREKQNCGTIYYESKRTKSFSPAWIEKFKSDIREKVADIGVLVTSAMPNGMERMGLVDGIWVCSFDEFKGLSAVLRESVIMIDSAGVSQENKGGKMEMLYDFLTGTEFRQQVEAIVEGFSQMKIDLDAEKRSMNASWKKREKQLEKVLLNTTYMHSSIRGIAGNAVQAVPQLEMPDDLDAEQA